MIDNQGFWFHRSCEGLHEQRQLQAQKADPPLENRAEMWGGAGGLGGLVRDFQTSPLPISFEILLAAAFLLFTRRL